MNDSPIITIGPKYSGGAVREAAINCTLWATDLSIRDCVTLLPLSPLHDVTHRFQRGLQLNKYLEGCWNSRRPKFFELLNSAVT